MARLFGFSIKNEPRKNQSIVSPVPQNNEDGVDHYLLVVFMVNILILKVYIEQNLI